MNADDIIDLFRLISTGNSNIDQIAETLYEESNSIIKVNEIIAKEYPIDYILDQSSNLNPRTLQFLLVIASHLSDSQEFPFNLIENEFHYEKLLKIMKVKAYFRSVIRLLTNLCECSMEAKLYYLKNNFVSTLNSFPKCESILKLAIILVKSNDGSIELNSDDLNRLCERHFSCSNEYTIMRNIEFAGLLTSLKIGNYYDRFDLIKLLNSDSNSIALGAVRFLLQIDEPSISYVVPVLTALERHPTYIAAEVFKLLEKNAVSWSGYQNDVVVGYIECILDKLPSSLLRVCLSTLLQYINFEFEWDEVVVNMLFSFIDEECFASKLLNILSIAIDRNNKGDTIENLDGFLKDAEEDIERLTHSTDENISESAEILLNYINTEL